MFNKNKLWCWIMAFLAALQATAQLLEYIIKDTTDSPFLEVWISLGNSMSQNWLAFSFTLVIITLGCIIYNELDNKTYQLTDDFSREIVLILNLILCNKIYSSSSCIEKINYFKENYSVIIAFVLIVLVSIAFGAIIKGHKEISKELEKSTPNDNNKEDFDDSDDEALFAWKHPILYSWYLSRYYSNKRKVIKNESKSETAKSKAAYKKKKEEYEFERLESLHLNKNKKRLENPILIFIQGAVSTILAFICVCFLIKAFVTDINSADNNIATFFSKIITNIISLRKVINDADTPIKNFLLSLGSALLFVILIITLYLLIYILIRVILYLIFQFNEDENQIKKIARAIKIFVFGIIWGAIRPMLFIPNFLKFIEEYLLEVEVEDVISDYYAENDNKSTAEESGDQISDGRK